MHWRELEAGRDEGCLLTEQMAHEKSLFAVCLQCLPSFPFKLLSVSEMSMKSAAVHGRRFLLRGNIFIGLNIENSFSGFCFLTFSKNALSTLLTL